ncbi:MAG: rRNA maturation RNase YbeY [Verrucomicrobiae bacterium]|nr:rRNA maturation RNase YbeY [Verrucomicrobiae bacterium]
MKPLPPPKLHVSLSNRQRHLRLDRKSLLEFLRAAAALAAEARKQPQSPGPRRRAGRRYKSDTDSARPATAPNHAAILHNLSVALVDDATIAALNQRFLNRPGPTDVLSFNLAPGLGELIVSAERAVIVARQLRRPPAAELALYLVHGLLHLAGFDDHTPAQRRAMRRAERQVLGTLQGITTFAV